MPETLLSIKCLKVLFFAEGPPADILETISLVTFFRQKILGEKDSIIHSIQNYTLHMLCILFCMISPKYIHINSQKQ